MTSASKYFFQSALGAALTSLLIACGGGGTSGTTSTTVTGLAATGTGIANAAVTARCASGTELAGATDANGIYALDLGTTRLPPCMLRVSGGTPAITLYGYADAAGRVNITPVTDLVIAKALGDNPETGFNNFDGATGNTISAGLGSAKTYVTAQIAAITGLTMAADPLNGAFAIGDAEDRILDALGAAMTNAGKTVADLRGPAAMGGALSTLVPAVPSTGVGVGGSSAAINCNTALFQAGAAIHTPSSTELASYARTYTGSEGSYDMSSNFAATASATLVFSANGSATYNGATLTADSYCAEALPNNAGQQLVIHAGASHFDLRSDGNWSGFSATGNAVSPTPYTGGSVGAASFGALTITGDAVGIQGASVPASFIPSAQGTHPTAILSWNAPDTASWFMSVAGNVVSSSAGFGSWQKQAALAGIESLGVVFDMPNGNITFNNVTLPAFALGQTGNMILNGTLKVPPATGTAVTITGTGTPAAGSGFDAPAATVSSLLLGSTTITTYTWNGGKGISIELKSYSTGTQMLTVSNAAGPSWRNTSAGAAVNIDNVNKTVNFDGASLSGLSPTTSALVLTGSLIFP